MASRLHAFTIIYPPHSVTTSTFLKYWREHQEFITNNFSYEVQLFIA